MRDKHLAAAVLAKALNADILLMLTDVEAVLRNWGTPIRRKSPEFPPDGLAWISFATRVNEAEYHRHRRLYAGDGRHSRKQAR